MSRRKKKTVNDYNWDIIQEDHNNGLFLTEIREKYEMSTNIMTKANKLGLFTKIHHKYITSEETKKLISQKRKAYLKENPDKHPWKNKDKFISEPCEYLKNKLKEQNIPYVEEYEPFLDKNRFFSVDIAFPDERIGIEVNGNQHYNRDGTLKSYYQERHDYFTANGWGLIEIHYSSVYSLDVGKILEFDYKEKDYIEYIKSTKNKKNKKYKKSILKEEVKSRRKEKLDNIEKLKLKIISSDIDFTKWGWSKKVADLIGILPQKAKGWVEKWMPDFYEEKCYKKKKTNPEDFMCECGDKKSSHSMNCDKCSRIKRRKVNRPDRQTLMDDIKKNGQRKTANKYGVCQSTIRKWVKYYES